MTNTPIDRESVERTRQEILDHCKGHPYAAIPWPHRLLHTAANTLLALRAALDEAEAERHFWRQAAAKGSIYTKADLDRAVAEARAVALQQAAKLVDLHKAHTIAEAHHYARAHETREAILALIDTPAAEALERVRAEERERLCTLMEGLAGEFGFVDVPMADSANQSAGMPRVGDQFAARMRTFVAAIRARGET